MLVVGEEMGDIGLLKQGWNWLASQKVAVNVAQLSVGCARERLAVFVNLHWPVLYSGCMGLWRFLAMLGSQWKGCVVRGFSSLVRLESAALFIIMWSLFLSLTSTSCLFNVILALGAAGATLYYIDYNTGLFIVGLFGILIMWRYGNIWLTGLLFVTGGYMFSLNHARLLIFMATAYSTYCAYVRVGWLGIFLSLNLAFLSNDILSCFLRRCDRFAERKKFRENKESESVPENFPADFGFSSPIDETKDIPAQQSSCRCSSTSNCVNIQKENSCSKAAKADSNSVDEIKRIMDSTNHYETLGLPRNKYIDLAILKKEYRRKAMLVHPDKNMGNSSAVESFKKLQCAYETLSDVAKKKDYDEQLRKEESTSIGHKTFDFSQESEMGYRSEESRRIECRKCGNSHLWICTTRSKTSARWCQGCQMHHSAKDGDGWVEYEYSTITSVAPKAEIPRAFVCAESKIFDVSEWVICQGMACRPNTHTPSFHVNMVCLDNATERSNPSRFHWDLDAEIASEDEFEFEVWLQQALASGLFSETPKRRKSWSPFKINQKLGMKSWRRFS